MKHLVLVILLCISVSLAAAAVRIALVPFDELAQNHADLALASLSTDDGFEFLEREKIDLIRKEVLLGALSDWVPDPRLMQNTELFVILKSKELLAFDAVTGVRLIDTQADTAEAVSQAVRAAVSKRQSLAAKRLRKLSCLPLIPVHLNDSQEKTARQLLKELLRQLGNRPDLVVLERHHLLLVLNEPGANTSDLTKNLFTGAIVIKPVATPETRDSIRLRVNFLTPDGQTSLGAADEVFIAEGDWSEACRLFLSQLKLPEGDYSDRAEEAHSFIFEAWFAVKHLISGQSLPAAASATALDDAHEQELCRIAALNATSLWHRHSVQRTERTAAALANLQLAERLAVKHNLFPSELVNAIHNGVGMIAPRDFTALEKSQQRELRATIDRLLAHRHRSLEEILRLAELPCDQWPERVITLETRMEYIREMSQVCEIAWDYYWWEKYVLPELSRYIKDSNEWMPELLRFMNPSTAERQEILSQAPMAARRAPRCRSWGILDLNPHDYLQFRRFYPKSQTPENIERYRRIMQTLTESNLLDLAFYGHFGLLRLQLGNTRHDRMRASPEDHAAVSAFMDTLVQLFATKEAPSVPYHLLTGLSSWINENTISQQFQIQELAMQRFAWCQPWNELVPNRPTWSRETASEVHRRLSEFNRQIQQDPRLHQNNTSKKEWLADYFRKQQRKLEKQYDIPSDQPALLPVVEPFERLVQLDLDFAAGKDYAIQVIGFDGRFIHLDHQSTPFNTLLSIDTAADLAITRQKHANTTGWCGTRHQGVILSNFLASGNGPFVFLYPKDGSDMQTLDFRVYFKNNCHAMVGGGDRLFLSFDGNGNWPGTVLEYNVITKESKRLVSTLDDSVVWPLQGRRQPYQISRLLYDGTNRRLLMLMHDQLPANYGVSLRFKAYHWETGEWRDASNLLPIPYNFHPIFLDKRRLWLVDDNAGAGPVNAEGNWQPFFLLNNNGYFTDKLPYNAANKANVTVDLSRLMTPPEKYRHLGRSDLFFTHFDDGILFAEKLLMLLPECHIITIPKRFRILACFAGKYVVGFPVTPDGRREPLHIGILKDRAKLLSNAEYSDAQ
ncbi:MAG: hypothetical protein GX617_04185 [Lentisphaerae bacterium]|nr:hypothetical protein [Lentisphaerota bacterium]